MSCQASRLERFAHFICQQSYLWLVENGSTLQNYRCGTQGALFKRNLINEWWSSNVLLRDQVFAFETEVLEGANSSAGVAEGNVLQECYGEVLRNFAHRQLPFGIARVGLCYSSTPPASLVELREQLLRPSQFTELRLQMFIPQRSVGEYCGLLSQDRLRWWRKFAACPDAIQVRRENNGSNFSLEYSCPWINIVLETVKHSGRFDYATDASGNSLQAYSGKQSCVPHLIDVTSHAEVAMLAYLADAYAEEPGLGSKNLIGRQSISLHPRLAPYKVRIALITDNHCHDLLEIGRYLTRELRQAGVMTLSHIGQTPRDDDASLRDIDLSVPMTVEIGDNVLEGGIVSLRSSKTTLPEQLHVLKVKERVLKFIMSY